MKRIFPIAAVAAIPIGIIVWGSWRPSVELISLNPGVGRQVQQEPGREVKRPLQAFAPEPPMLIHRETGTSKEGAKNSTILPEPKAKSNIIDSASGDEVVELAVLDATPLELERTGYAELFAGSDSSYASYDIDTIVTLAESGDKRALLHAVLARSDIPVAQRKLYAIEAAKQGYTSALATLGQMLLMPESATASDRVTGFALLRVSRELNDPVLRVREDGDIWPFMKYHISAKQQERAEIEARKLLDQIGMEI